MRRTIRAAGARCKRRLINLYGSIVLWRERRRSQRSTVEPGVTVVTANWNTLHFLQTLIEQVRLRSAPSIRIVVVDNASTDGSREFLRSNGSIDSVLLCANVLHGRAIDIALARSRTETVVVLDVDAFPVSDAWLDEALAALDEGKVLYGAHIHRNYIHPCFLVARRSTLVGNRLSFRPVGTHPMPGHKRFGLHLDAGEAVSQAVVVRFGQASIVPIPISEMRGPGIGGAVFGGLVYHNFYSTYGEHAATAITRFDEAVERWCGVRPEQ